MKKFLLLQNPSSISFLVLVLCVISCANLKDRENRTAPSPAPTNAASSENLPTGQRIESSITASFAAKSVCSLPKQAAPNTPFANLGGGTWGKWGDSNGDLDYGCNDAKDSINLKADGNVEITAEYGAIGGTNAARYISAEYMAMQYSGQTPTEKELRQQYADFCDKLSEKIYGQKLPAKFKKRLLDESTYSASGTANEYGEEVGNGFVNLSSNKNKTILILLDVHFFSSEAEYKKYKDS